jgi:uncharacterized membrane protein
MDHRLIIRNALLGLIAASGAAHAAESVPVPVTAGKEKCYGVAKAGQNDCASVVGTHSCAGQAKADNDPTEWKLAAKGTCEKMGGKLIAAKKQ